MDIIPDRKKFIHLASSSSRVPVYGEEQISNLDPFLLFKELFQYSEQSFLLESGKGPIETAQFSIFGCSSSRMLKIFGKKANLYKNGILETQFNQVDEAYKKSRLEEVQNILRDQQLEFNKQSINSALKILVLKIGKKPNQYLGRSQYNQSVYFNCNEKNIIGSTVNINVTQAFQNSLTGNIINI